MPEKRAREHIGHVVDLNTAFEEDLAEISGIKPDARPAPMKPVRRDPAASSPQRWSRPLPSPPTGRGGSS